MAGAGDVRAILAAAGKTAEEFIEDLFADQAACRAGEPCPRCQGRLKVVNTRIRAGWRIRYVGCGRCGFRPLGNKQVSRVCATSATQGTISGDE